MPFAPAPPCLHPGCPQRRPCSVHGVEDRPRSQSHLWYMHARWCHPLWGIRAQRLALDPLCVECRRENRVERATEVDHVIPHRGDRLLFFNLANTQSLCHVHHALKTRRGE